MKKEKNVISNNNKPTVVEQLKAELQQLLIQQNILEKDKEIIDLNLKVIAIKILKNESTINMLELNKKPMNIKDDIDGGKA